MRMTVSFRERIFKRDGSIQWYDLNSGVAEKKGQFGMNAEDLSTTTDSHMQLKLSIVAGDGCEVAETNDNPAYTAPQSGYGRQISHEFGFKDGSYYGKCDVKFYIKTNAAIYAVIEAKLQPIGGMIEPKVVVWQNPSGSRNLEYVESMSIKDGQSGH